MITQNTKKSVRKSIINSIVVMIAVVFVSSSFVFLQKDESIFLSAGAGKASTLKKAPDQIVLSYTSKPVSTQTITWKSKQKTTLYVKYQTKKKYQKSGKYGFTAKGKVRKIKRHKYYRYTVNLTKLKPGTQYYYKVGAGKKWSKKRSFTTESESIASGSEDFRFMCLGDAQFVKGNMKADYKKWGSLISFAYKKNPETKFSIFLGDFVNNPKKLSQWNQVLARGSKVFDKIPLMPTSGNHEEKNSTLSIYLKLFALPQNGPKGLRGECYSFDYGNCHFVSLNSNLLSDKRKKQMGSVTWEKRVSEADAWLKKDLTSSQAKWKFVYMHHPIYPISDNDPTLYSKLKEHWEQTMIDADVTAVLNGHQHLYMRTEPQSGIVYITASSGQKPSAYYKAGDPIPDYVEKYDLTLGTYQIFKVHEDSVVLFTYNKAGEEIDTYTFI